MKLLAPACSTWCWCLLLPRDCARWTFRRPTRSTGSARSGAQAEPYPARVRRRPRTVPPTKAAVRKGDAVIAIDGVLPARACPSTISPARLKGKRGTAVELVLLRDESDVSLSSGSSGRLRDR
jgi:hypothetical protein